MPSVYVTGTDTDAGKTWVSAALLHVLRREGRAVGMKPVASGCAWTAEGWRNADALALQAARDPGPEYALLNPFALPEPTAPGIAAQRAGVTLDLAPIMAAHAALAALAPTVLVEGVGGWLAPLSDTLEQADLCRALCITDAVLVVGLRLGCINHARLTAKALAADGMRLRGWIGSAVDPGLAFPEETLAILRATLGVPCLGVIPFDPSAPPEARADRIVLPAGRFG